MSDPLKLPEPLQLRLKSQLGEAYPAFQQALSQPPPVSIRLNPRKAIPELFAREARVPWCEQGRYLPARPRFTLDPYFHAGAYYVQEASSMFLCHLLPELIDLKRDLRVLDLSAAPGGKTTLLQSLLTPDSLLVANEVITSRNKVLRQNLTRWGGDNHIVTQSNPRQFQQLGNFFDIILVDAPCSGEGLIRKDPAAIQHWSQANVQLCAARQKRILADVLPALAPGGLLIYSTCTYSLEENEANLVWLKQSSRLIPLSLEIPPAWGIQSETSPGVAYRFYPHRLTGEGLFMAAFKKPENSQQATRQQHRSNVGQQTEPADREDRHWLSNPERYLYLTRAQYRIAFPRSIFSDFQAVSRSLRITQSGLNLGKRYHGRLKPSPELALSQFLSPAVPSLELDPESALDFLAHLNFHSLRDNQPGRYLIRYQGLGVGWIKILANGQIRNNYPTAWRILNRNQ